MLQNSNQHPNWIEKCRKSLIDLEEQNLRTRALYWTQIVNMKTSEFNNKLNIRLNIPIKPFEYKISNPITSHLNYLISWRGLRSEKLIAIPQKYKDFEFKAKNWLCGRRAPNYANTLFPDMILNAEYYSTNLSLVLFNDCTEIANLYKFGLMYGYLSMLCSTKITLNDKSKKTFLMFENSIKNQKNNKTVKLLQKYATDININNMELAYKYFQAQYENCFHLLQKQVLLLYQNRQNNNNNNMCNPKQIASNHSNQNINNQNPNQICNLLNNLLHLQQQQNSNVKYLTSRVHQLESILVNQFNMDLSKIKNVNMNMNNNNNVIMNNNMNKNNMNISVDMRDISHASHPSQTVTTPSTSHSSHSPITPNDNDIILNDFGLNNLNGNNNNNTLHLNGTPVNVIPVHFVPTIPAVNNSNNNNNMRVNNNNNNNNNNNAFGPGNTVIVNNMYDLAALVGNL